MYEKIVKKLGRWKASGSQSLTEPRQMVKIPLNSSLDMTPSAELPSQQTGKAQQFWPARHKRGQGKF